MRPLVTIAIPTFNRAEATLRDALGSALAQTYPNLEILVADNGSTDGTAALVTSVRDPRLRYHRHPQNIGPNDNFNFCVATARGVYFLLLHDDDLLDPDMVAACLDAVGDAEDVGLIRTGTRLIDAEGRVLGEHPNEVGGVSTRDFFLGWFTGRTALYLASTLFNTRRLREIGGFRSPRNLYQDVVAEVTLAAKFGRADVREVKAAFRMHTNMLYSREKIGWWCDDSAYLLETMCGLLAPEDASILRAVAQPAFCRRMYHHASRLPSRMERMRTYREIARRFDGAYSPVRFVVDRAVGRRVAMAKRAVRSALPPWLRRQLALAT